MIFNLSSWWDHLGAIKAMPEKFINVQSCYSFVFLDHQLLFSPHNKEVPVEERNGVAHDEEEQQCEEEEYEIGEEEAEVADDEAMEEDAEGGEEMMGEEEEEETDEVTQGTVIGAWILPPVVLPFPPSLECFVLNAFSSIFPSFLECSVFYFPSASPHSL